MKYIKLTLSIFAFICAISATGYAVKMYKDNQNQNASSGKQVSDANLVNDAKLTLSNNGILNPTADEDTNIVSLAESLVGADDSGLTVKIISSNNPQISTDGTITYGETSVTGDVVISITRNNVTVTQTISITVPPQSAADLDKDQVLAAKEALSKATLRPAEGADTNITTMAQKVVDEVSNGVTVKIALSDNKQISIEGAITYIETAVTGSVKFAIKKNLASSTITIDVTVPAKASSSQQTGTAIGRDLSTVTTTTTTTRPATTTTTLAPTTTIPPTTTTTVASTTTTAPSTTTTTVSPTTTTTVSSTTTSTSTTTTTVSPTTTTTIDSDSGNVAAAKAALAAVSLHPIEGTDTNVIPIAQAIVNSATSGVLVGVSSSSNSQVSGSGDITYGSSEVSGNVTFSLSKGSANDTQDVNVIVPARTVDVTDYGATGGDSSDDTAAINSAITYINGLGGGNVYVPDGTYMIDALTSVNMKNNVNLTLFENATLQAIGNSSENYKIVNFYNISNASIVGGSVIGERETHSGTTGEWGMGINIAGSSNIRVANINISDCWGDGIYLGTTGSQNFVNNVLIEDFVSDNNRRQGISVISAKNLTIRDGIVSNTNGTDPKDGIDLEPNNINEFMQNILIENIQSINNGFDGTTMGGRGLDFSLSNVISSPNPISIVVNNFTDDGSYQGNMSSYTGYIDSMCSIQINQGLSAATGVTNIVSNGNFADTTGWLPTGASIATSNNILSATGDGTQQYPYIRQATGATGSIGDKFYVRGYLKADATDTTISELNVYLKVNGATNYFVKNASEPELDRWYNVSGVVTLTNSGTIDIIGRFYYPTASDSTDKTVQMKDFMAVNLTQMYGAGNEPSSGECEELFPNGSTPSTTTTTTLPPITTTSVTSTTTTTTLLNTDYEDIQTARAALASASILPIEGTDINVIPIAQSIVDSAVSGVTVDVFDSSNPQVADDGTIAYGAETESGNITFSFVKGAEFDTQDVYVVINERTANVLDYGATGDGLNDDTDAIQAAIDYIAGLGGGKVYLPDGTYMVTAPYDWGNAIELKNNIDLYFSWNAIIQINTNNYNGYGILGVKDVSDVEIFGGSIVGDKETHTGTTGEWGIGINIEGSNNINISAISVSDCWGDGMYIGSSTNQNFSQGVLISDFDLNNNRRQGISVISAKDLTIQNGIISNTNGTPPQSAIDIEPNASDEWAYNIILQGITTSNNGEAEHDTGFGGWGFDVWFGCGTEDAYTTPANQVSIDVISLSSTGNLRGNITTNAYDYIDYGYDISIQ